MNIRLWLSARVVALFTAPSAEFLRHIGFAGDRWWSVVSPAEGLYPVTGLLQHGLGGCENEPHKARALEAVSGQAKHRLLSYQPLYESNTARYLTKARRINPNL